MKRTCALIVSILTLLSLLLPCFTALADGDFDDDRELFAEAEKILMGSEWELVEYCESTNHANYSMPKTFEYKRNLETLNYNYGGYYSAKYWSLLTVSNGALHLTVYGMVSGNGNHLHTYDLSFEWVNGMPQYMVWAQGANTAVYKRVG